MVTSRTTHALSDSRAYCERQHSTDRLVHRSLIAINVRDEVRWHDWPLARPWVIADRTRHSGATALTR